MFSRLDYIYVCKHYLAILMQAVFDCIVFLHFGFQGMRSSDMKAWRQHWDHQLYKALEHQYQMGLEALNENLPEITIDLTFK